MKNPLSINPNRLSQDSAYMQMAEIWAKRSKSNRKQVGAILVKDRRIISDGYNGLPAGCDDDICEFLDDNDNLVTKDEVLHAESNCIVKLASGSGGSENSTMYVTLSPCFQCAKLIIQSRIARVVFKEKYRDESGIVLLKKYGISVEQIGE